MHQSYFTVMMLWSGNLVDWQRAVRSCCYGLLLVLLVYQLAHAEPAGRNYDEEGGKQLQKRGLLDNFNDFLQDVYLDIPAEPETKMNTVELIKRHGYKAESHDVTTSDGYILQLHRILPARPAKNGRVVLVMHSFLGSSADWVLNLPSQSLGFILADAGLDVWLGNARGNTYSRKHVTMDPDENQNFWKFTIDEHAHYDLPAMLNYVLKTTRKNQLEIVGHCLGTTTTFAMLSNISSFNNKISMFYALAPVVRMDNIRSIPIRILALVRHPVLIPLARGIFGGEALSNRGLLNLLAVTVGASPLGPPIYGTIFDLIYGGDSVREWNRSRVDVIMSHYPTGSSWLAVDHFMQFVSERQFAHYDYGRKGNLEKYGQSKPPVYNLKQVSVPIKMYYAPNDFLADSKDVSLLESLLSPGVVRGVYQVGNNLYGHWDFLWGIRNQDTLKQFIKDITQLS